MTAYLDEDWHSRRLVEAARRRGRTTVLRPTDFSVQLEAGRPIVRARGTDVRRFHVMLTPRALGERGDGDFHLEAYRLMAEQGLLLVNDVRALCDAIDKLRSSVLLARAGVPTPPVVVVQDPAAAA